MNYLYHLEFHYTNELVPYWKLIPTLRKVLVNVSCFILLFFITQLQSLIDTIDLKESKVMKKIKEEVSRFKKFQLSLLGKNTDIKISNIDLKKYVKFILKDGVINQLPPLKGVV